jgi:hypothetical protein
LIFGPHGLFQGSRGNHQITKNSVYQFRIMSLGKACRVGDGRAGNDFDYVRNWLLARLGGDGANPKSKEVRCHRCWWPATMSSKVPTKILIQRGGRVLFLASLRI